MSSPRRTAAVARYRGRGAIPAAPSPRRLVVASRYLIIVPSTKVTSFRRAIVVVALPPRGVRRRALLVTARRRHADSSSRVSFGKISDHRSGDDVTSLHRAIPAVVVARRPSRRRGPGPFSFPCSIAGLPVLQRCRGRAVATAIRRREWISDDRRPWDDVTSRACFRASFWEKSYPGVVH